VLSRGLTPVALGATRWGSSWRSAMVGSSGSALRDLAGRSRDARRRPRDGGPGCHRGLSAARASRGANGPGRGPPGGIDGEVPPVDFRVNPVVSSAE
jgi:hypothetical protein